MENIKFHDQTELINCVAGLLERLQKEDQQAFSELYNITASYIVMMIKNSKVEEADCDDLLQEIYCAIYTSVSTLKHCQAGFAWIKRIANNKIIDYTRKKYKEEQHQILTFEREGDGEEELEIENDLFEMPEDVVDNKETQRLVRKILMGLPEKQYRVLFAFYFNNMKIDEIAKVMEMNVNTVKTNLQRAKKSFKEQVEQLQKNTGVVLRTIPMGIVLFLLFSKDEAVYAGVLAGRPVVEQEITKIKGNSVKNANVVRNTVKTGIHKSMTLKIGIVSVAFLCGMAGGLWKNQRNFVKQNKITLADTEQKTVSDIKTDKTVIQPEEAFKKFLSKQKTLFGNKISVEVVKAGQGDMMHLDYSGTKLSEGAIGYKIDDFDQDGNKELLLLMTHDGNRVSEDSEEETDITAGMYEFIDGNVVLQDEADYGMVDTRANDLMSNWVIYGSDKWLLQESYVGLSAVSDGYYREFCCLKYNGTEFEFVFGGEFEGSSNDDVVYTKEVKKACKNLNISEEHASELENCPFFSSYLKKKEFIAQIVTETVVDIDQIMQEQQKIWDGQIEQFHVADGEVRHKKWIDFKQYMDKKYTE